MGIQDNIIIGSTQGTTSSILAVGSIC